MKAIAELVSKRSTCGRLTVGAIVTNSDFSQILSYGYNGGYTGGPNRCEMNIPGLCGCVHAEVNALIKAPKEKDRKMFVTDSPCVICSKLIINAGISEVYYSRAYRNPEGLRLLGENGVLVKEI